MIAELDGTLFQHPVAAFRVLPYLARRSLNQDQVRTVLDVAEARLDEMRTDEREDPEHVPLVQNRTLDALTGASLRA